MKKAIFLNAFLMLLSVPSFAQNQMMCRHHLFNLLGLDAQKPKVSVTKKLMGVVDEVKVRRFNSPLVKGGPCELSISVYQPSGPVAGITIQEASYTFNPFNHSVGAKDASENCEGMDANFVRGSSSYKEKFGWRNSYKTNISLQKNSDGTYTLTYKISENGSNDSITCTGVIR